MGAPPILRGPRANDGRSQAETWSAGAEATGKALCRVGKDAQSCNPASISVLRARRAHALRPRFAASSTRGHGATRACIVVVIVPGAFAHPTQCVACSSVR